MTASVSGFSIIQGMASALDTLLPSAWTSSQPHLVGLWTQRMSTSFTHHFLILKSKKGSSSAVVMFACLIVRRAPHPSISIQLFPLTDTRALLYLAYFDYLVECRVHSCLFTTRTRGRPSCCCLPTLGIFGFARFDLFLLLIHHSVLILIVARQLAYAFNCISRSVRC